MSRYRSSSSDSSWAILFAQCGCWLVVAVINLIFGGMSVNYLLTTFLEKAIPFGWAMVLGLFVGEFTIPASIVVWILKLTHIL